MDTCRRSLCTKTVMPPVPRQLSIAAYLSRIARRLRIFSSIIESNTFSTAIINDLWQPKATPLYFAAY